REVKEADAVFAIGGKILLDFHAAAQTGCNWNFRVRVAGGLVAPTGNGRTHVAYGFLRDTAGRIEVLVEEGGRGGEGEGDIIEALDLNVLRENVFFVDVHAEQGFHGCGVLGTVQALDTYVARGRPFGMRVERRLHPRGERFDFFAGRLGGARRRHEVAAQVAQGLFPNGGVGRGVGEIEFVEGESSGFEFGVVAGDAIFVEKGAVGVGGFRSGRGHLTEYCR